MAPVCIFFFLPLSLIYLVNDPHQPVLPSAICLCSSLVYHCLMKTLELSCNKMLILETPFWISVTTIFTTSSIMCC